MVVVCAPVVTFVLAPVIETSHQPTEWIDAERNTKSLEQWKGQQVAAFCGIGNPEAFCRTLTDLGISERGAA